ncbi:odorant receptor 33b-like [Anastrepha ludens]|uniref:odorant receptor 33b-like n=1 Tax=Anastrepha ludens TaxID=28586 RepID=UPI0023B16036|nr:odorant receptor 33b-like [Anastrepha ludens]
MLMRQIDTIAIFRRLFITWRALGIILWPFNKYLRIVYDLLMTIFVTFGFPLHLVLGIIFSTNQEQFFINLVIGIASVSCTLKHLLLRYRLSEMLMVNEILARLDERVHTNMDYDYYKRFIERPCNFMINFFTRCYFAVSITALLTALVTGELLYPAFVPLAWRTSISQYIVAILFQFAGVSLQIVQNIANDAYGPVVLCMLSGHVHLLANRVSRVSHSSEENIAGNSTDLALCIEDHKLLRSTSNTVERIVSASYLVQFVGVGINLCIGLVYLLFFADNYFAYVYYSLHVTAIMIELFPCCYFGSMLECEFHDLSYAIFRSNWPTQPRAFRRNVVNFTELTLREVTLYAGGMIRINLDSFFATCKMGYSFFTVIQSMK